MKLNLSLFIVLSFTIFLNGQLSAAELASEEDKSTQMTLTSKTPIKSSPSRRSSKLLGMSVIGNKESPRSLTIVPWREPAMKGKSPYIIPVWQPTLGLLEPDSYRRNINLFLRNKTQ